MPAKKKKVRKKATRPVATRKKAKRKVPKRKTAKRKTARNRWGSKGAREEAENGKIVLKIKGVIKCHQDTTAKIVRERHRAEVKLQERLLSAMKKVAV